MPGDYTRFRFSAANNASGILQQQGRVMLDQDWNELVEIIDRRFRAETADVIGNGVVPRQTSHAFEIQVVGGNDLTIGPGRIYVDGMLAENHGTAPQYDTVLEETPGAQPIAFAAQPYAPTSWPFGGTNPFAMPTGAGPHLVYLDVWKREVTALQAPDLVDKAVGVDTTTRLQTAWQVKVLPNIPVGSTCTGQIPEWTALTLRSAGQLSTAAAGLPLSTDPCIIPPNTGYRGIENRTYRIEVHVPGGFGTAQFKFARDAVASPVTAINSAADVLTVVRTKLDSVLRFSPGVWVEVTDDFHELGGVPGEMHQILTVDDVNLTLTLRTPLTAAQFNITNPTQRNTRVILWNQSGAVRDISNNIIVDVDQNGGLIPIKQNTTVALEDGIQLTFSLDPAVTTTPQFQIGDYWTFTARVVDASIDILTNAPTRGIHHHYCRLAVVSFPGTPSDCRTFWPPDFGGDCECAACVDADDHNSGKFTIQNAIDQAKGSGGKVCLAPGVYALRDAIKISGALALQVLGHGQAVLVAPPGTGNGVFPAILVDNSSFVTLTGFGLVMAPGSRVVLGSGSITSSTPGIMIQNSVAITVERCQFYSFGNLLGTNPAIAIGGFLGQARVWGNSFSFWSPDAQGNLVTGPGTGIGHLPTIADKSNPFLLTLDLFVEDNLMQCGSSGISLDKLCYHAREVWISRNVIGATAVAGIAVAGIGVPASASRVEITGNEIGVTSAPVATGDPGAAGGVTNGNAIVCGVSAARIIDNDIVSQGTASGDGILLDVPLISMPLDGCQILGNRVSSIGGIGIEIRAAVASAMIKQNTIQGTGGGIVMTGQASAHHLGITNNQLLGLVPAVDQQAVLGVHLTFVAAAEIESNIIRDLGLDASSTVPRMAISLIGCAASRIAGNQISNIGPVAPTFAPAAPSAAIAATGPTFDRAEVSGNIIRRSDQIGLSVGNFTLWRAIYVGPQIAFAGAATHSVAQTSAGQFVVVAENVLAAINPGPQLAAVRGNVMEGGSAGPFSPVGSFVELEVTGSGVFTDNQGTLLTPPNTNPPPLATLTAPMIAASNNILSGGAPTLQIKGPADIKVTALGNITVNAASDPILVNGQPLGAPWAPLNVHT
jgi:hypothetical protein